MIEDRIAEMTLKGEVKADATISVSVKRKVLSFAVHGNKSRQAPLEQGLLNTE